MSHLYIVATPIGNLKDISPRALQTLQQADFILCEDTRRTQKLLNHFNIKTPSISFHQHSKQKKVNYILKLLKQDKNLALVSDAGTPGIADPGGKLIEEVKKQLGQKVLVSPIPGPSAITAAASVAGIPLNRFLFLGYPPKKRKRKKFFQEISNSKYPVIFFESPHRLLKTLRQLQSIKRGLAAAALAPESQELRVILCRELTKIHEKIYRGSPAEIINQLKNNSQGKGEYTIITNF